MAVGKPLQLRLFLEGEEVPVIAAQVSISTNAPAAASIQIVPLDEGMDFLPRTMVHLFFLDSFESRTSAPDAGSRNEQDRLNIAFLDNYKLLFSGEVIGFQFVQIPSSRAIVLQCLDFSSYWDTAHATALEYGPNGNAFTHQGALRASNTGLFDDIVNTTSDQLVRWISQQPQTPGLTNVSGLAGGVIHMLEMMGGVPQHFRGVNDFFTIAELRCRILAQITAEENDTTAAGLLRVSVFDEWLRNGLQNAGQQISFRDMLKLLFGYIHYEVVPNPAAKFEPTLPGSTQPRIVTGRLKEHPQAIKALSDISQVKTSLQQYSAERDKITLAAVVRNYKEQLKVIDTNLATLQAAKRSLSRDVQRARSSLSTAINALESNPNPEDTSFIQTVLNALTQVETVITTSTAVVSSQMGSITTGGTQRLRSQIIRPDCFFSPPPRCNVIFPEQYTQLSYDRMFLSEATRSLVLGYNTLVGQDALLADRILAPSVGVDTELLAVKSGREGYRALMKHELHTGIIPRSEWLPNTSSFSAAKTDPNKDNKTADRVSWGRKIALFHFFKYRFGPRQASIGARFNPYMVCGFPALVITRPFIIPGVSQTDTSTDQGVIDMLLSQSRTGANNILLAPSQLLGMVTGLAHNIDQNGGSTSISMSHVRKHLGVDDEFLGVFLQSAGTTRKRIRVKLRADEVARSSKQSLKDILVKVTPQIDPASSSATAMRNLSQITAQQQTTSFDFVSKKKVEAPSTMTFEVLQEGSTSPPSDVPPLTSKGPINNIDKVGLVPNPPGRLTVNSQGVFGRIIAIEVTDATITSLATQAATVTPGLIDLQTVSTADQARGFQAIAAGGGPSTQALTDAMARRKANDQSVRSISQQVYTEVVLYEEVEIATEISTPIEEIIRPKWFSNSYSNTEIGRKIYQPFFGVPSIIDEAAFDGLGENTTSSVPPNNVEGETANSETDLTALKTQLSQEENARARLSIERSVNFISYIYGLVKVKGLDVDDFIRQYANRPIATLPEILGDPDLDLQLDSQGVATPIQVAGADGTTRTPRMGFHSLAVHPKVVDAGNLAGLLTEPDLHVQRINNTGEAGAIPPEYDVRKAKKDRVRSYIAALSLGPGFRG